MQNTKNTKNETSNTNSCASESQNPKETKNVNQQYTGRQTVNSASDRLAPKRRVRKQAPN